MTIISIFLWFWNKLYIFGIPNWGWNIFYTTSELWTRQEWPVTSYGDIHFKWSFHRWKAETRAISTVQKSSKTDITMKSYGPLLPAPIIPNLVPIIFIYSIGIPNWHRKILYTVSEFRICSLFILRSEYKNKIAITRTCCWTANGWPAPSRTCDMILSRSVSRKIWIGSRHGMARIWNTHLFQDEESIFDGLNTWGGRPRSHPAASKIHGGSPWGFLTHWFHKGISTQTCFTKELQ